MIEVYDPTGIQPTNETTVAPRPTALKGLKIGILENSKTNADVLLERVASRLSERGAELIVKARKEIWGLPAPVEVIESLAHCEAVIAAHGG